MEGVITSFLNNYAAITWPRLRGTWFSWLMASLGILDVVLLFWIINPFAQRADRLTPAKGDPTEYVADSTGAKPSPLGAITTYKPKVSRPHAVPLQVTQSFR